MSMKTIYNKDGLVAKSDGEGVILELYGMHRIEMTEREFFAIAKVLSDDVNVLE